MVVISEEQEGNSCNDAVNFIVVLLLTEDKVKLSSPPKKPLEAPSVIASQKYSSLLRSAVLFVTVTEPPLHTDKFVLSNVIIGFFKTFTSTVVVV